MALGTEMLSLLAMIVTGDWWLGALAGKTVIAAFTPLTALALLAAGRRLFSPTAGIVAALIYFSVPWVVSIASGGLVEGASACYLFLAVYALLLRDSDVGRQLTAAPTACVSRTYVHSPWPAIWPAGPWPRNIRPRCSCCCHWRVWIAVRS